MVVIDTEGLGDVEKEQNNDVRIFMLAVLLSSHIIFNCTGVIDNDSISQLSLVSQMTNRIRLSNADKHSNPDEVEPEEFAQFFPDITLLVRDFCLQLVDKDNKSITPDQYLENALVDLPGRSTAIVEKNRIRSAIRLNFPK